jgi:hypothetical protein
MDKKKLSAILANKSKICGKIKKFSHAPGIVGELNGSILTSLMFQTAFETV